MDTNAQRLAALEQRLAALEKREQEREARSRENCRRVATALADSVKRFRKRAARPN